MFECHNKSLGSMSTATFTSASGARARNSGAITRERSSSGGHFATTCQRYTPRSFARTHGLAGRTDHPSPPKSRICASSSVNSLSASCAQRARPFPRQERWPFGRTAGREGCAASGAPREGTAHGRKWRQRGWRRLSAPVGLNEHAPRQVGTPGATCHLLQSGENVRSAAR